MTSRAYWAHGMEVLMHYAFEHAARDDCDRRAHDGREAHKPCGQLLRQRMMESLWATLKKEIACRQHVRTHHEARAAISQ